MPAAIKRLALAGLRFAGRDEGHPYEALRRAVNGQPVTKERPVTSLLVHQAGAKVELTFQDKRTALVTLLKDEVPARYRDFRVTTTPEARRAVEERVREREDELARLRDGNPRPKLWKRFDTPGFGAGRNVRFGDLDGDGVPDMLIAQNIPRIRGDGFDQISCLTAVTLEGKVLWQQGRPDPRWQRQLAEALTFIAQHFTAPPPPWETLHHWLSERLQTLQAGGSAAFQDVAQARAVLELLFGQLLPAYRRHHMDLLAHQSDRDLFQWSRQISALFEVADDAICSFAHPFRQDDDAKLRLQMIT